MRTIMIMAKIAEFGIFKQEYICCLSVADIKADKQLMERTRSFKTHMEALEWVNRLFVNNPRFKWEHRPDYTIYAKTGVGMLYGICEDLKRKDNIEGLPEVK